MKAAKLYPGKFEVIDASIPKIKDKEVLIRIKYCGICGSDLNIYRKDPPIPKYWPGHEISGIVEDSAPGSTFKKGENVVIKPLITCGTCDYCRMGEENFCKDYLFVGINYPGGFAEFISVPEKVVYKLKTSQALECGALLEPLSCAYHALTRFPIKDTDNILVVGAGVQGLLSVLLLKKHFKIKNVDIVYKYEHQRKMASEFGANNTIAYKDPQTNQYDVIIESVGGNGESFQKAIIWSKPMGKIVLLGTCYANPQINTKLITEKQLTVYGSHRYTTSDFEKTLVISNRINNELLALITHRFTLKDIEAAFTVAFNKEKEKAIKVLIFNN